MISEIFRGTIARKLLLAFFSVFIVTYFVTALVVESSVRSAVTDAELDTLSQLAQLKLGSINSRFDRLSTNLYAWAKLDVMNDIVSGDVDKRIEHTLRNLATDYALDGEIYVFNPAGQLVAASDMLHIDSLPDVWKPRGVRVHQQTSKPCGWAGYSGVGCSHRGNFFAELSAWHHRDGQSLE